MLNQYEKKKKSQFVPIYQEICISVFLMKKVELSIRDLLHHFLLGKQG